MIANDVFSVYLFSLLISFAAVISPGPVTAAIISEAPRSGWRAGLYIAFGHSILELMILILISLGLSVAMQTPQIQFLISFCGSLILLWIGTNYILAMWKDKIHLHKPIQSNSMKSSATLIGLGMITTLSNPFWYMWWVTVAAGYLVQVKAISTIAVVAFYIGHVSADFSWDTTLAAVTNSGRRWLSHRAYRLLVFFTGGFMTYLGLRYLFYALEMI